MKTWKQNIKIDLTDDQTHLVKIIHNGKETEEVAKVFIRKDNGQVLGYGAGYNSPADVKTQEVIPIRDGGVIVDFAHWEAFIDHMIAKAMEGTRFWRLRLRTADVRIKCPLYEIEHRALVDSLKHAGIRDVQVSSENDIMTCGGDDQLSIDEEESKKLDKKLRTLHGDNSKSTPWETAICYCPAAEPRQDRKKFWHLFDDDNDEELPF